MQTSHLQQNPVSPSKEETITVLLVEDNPADTELCLRKLRQCKSRDYTTHCCSNLSDATTLLQTEHVDIVLLDLSLPDSYELSGLLKITEEFTHLPIIILTGLEDDDIALRSITLGAQDYLIKGNYGSDLLEKTIQYAIERAEASVQLLEKDRKMNNLVSQLPGMVYTAVIGKSFELTYISNGCVSLTGCTEDELLQKERFFKLIPGDRRLEVQGEILTSLKKRGHVDIKFPIAVGDTTKWIWLQGITHTQTGDQVEFEGLMLDVTDEKTKEAELALERRKTLEAQSQLLSTQLNPHFIFNTLNSLQHHILEENVVEALNLTSAFATLSRAVLSNSTKPYINLDEEVHFLRQYLEIEQHRLANGMTFSVECDPELLNKDVTIPPMLLQPLVENAAIHGLGSSVSNGHIRVEFHQHADRLQCIVEDNGIGLKRSEKGKLKFQEEKAHYRASNILEEKLTTLELLWGRPIHLRIMDLESETNGKKRGTRVELLLPMMLED